MTTGTLGWLLAIAVWSPAAQGAVVAPAAESGDVPSADAPTEEGVVSLAWNVPPGCPDEAAVREGLRGYLGERPTAEGQAEVRAEGTIVEVDGGGFRLSLRTQTESGVTTRETFDERCDVLVDATALIIAIAVDPSVVLNRVPPGPVVEPPQEPAPEVEVEPPASEPTPPETPPSDSGLVVSAADAEPAPAVPRRVRFGMRAGGGAIVGAVPNVGGGFRFAGGLIGPRWRAELLGDYWLPRTEVASEGIGGQISLWTVGARGCWTPTVATVFEFPLCGGAEGGVLRGDPVGDGVADGRTSRRPWFAFDGSAGFSWAPRRFLAVMVQAEISAPLLRSGFRVGEVEVYRPSAVGGRFVAGLEARFP